MQTDSRYKVLIGKQINIFMLYKMYKLYNGVLDSNYSVNLIWSIKILFKTIEGYILVYDKKTKQIAGITTLFLLTDEFSKDFINGKKTYKDIKPRDCIKISKASKNTLYHFYCGIIGVNPALNNQLMVFRVLNEFVKFMYELAQKSIYGSELIADIASNYGGRLSSILGMKYLLDNTDGSKMFKVELLPFNLKYKSGEFDKLRKLYEAKNIELSN